MEKYLVGGAVRDRLLGLPVSERDWVVVGSTPEDMRALGFTPVGKDFPVFLHPQTKEEYALARTERKSGHGYTGFEISSTPGITLEQDLLRRDLTINAMAETADGELIDPYNGKTDLDKRVLRHVSPAFSEDPVRVLRTARFAASLAHLGFQVASTTNDLMQTMVASGEIDHLVPERVWAELEKALRAQTPGQFFKVLLDCDALPVLFPEIIIDSGSFRDAADADIQLPALGQAVSLTEKPEVRFAALVCDIDNGNPAGLDNSRFIELCNRHRIPNAYRELAGLALEHRAAVHGLATAGAAQVLDLLNALDAFRREQRCEDFLTVCEAEARSANPSLKEYAAAGLLGRARQAAREVKIDTGGLDGKAIGEQIRAARIAALEEILQPS